ncbi:MAG: hypothetical protein R3E65_04950 [Steroidobacteraceae bacterium]
MTAADRRLGASTLDAEFGTLDVLSFVQRQWRVLLAMLLLGAVSGVVAALLITPRYRAEAIVLPVASDGGGGVLARLAGQLGPLAGVVGNIGVESGGATSREVSVATLSSRSLLKVLIEKNGLKPIIFSERWDSAAKAWKQSSSGSLEPTDNQAIEQIQRRLLGVSEDKRSGLVTVSIEWKDPVLAARWANAIVSEANEMLRQRVISENERSVAYLESKLKETTVLERQQILLRLIESRTNEAMLARGRPEFALSVVDSAVAPDSDDPIFPNFALMTVLGSALGLSLALLFFAARGFVSLMRSRGDQ